MSPITIALDGMGGDFAPQAVVEGADLARESFPDVRFLLFGQSERLTPLLSDYPSLMAVTELVNCQDSISNDEKVAKAIRSGRQSSMALAIDAVKHHRAQAVVSSGNTGVLMALALFALRTMPGIDRPAICTSFPTITGRACMLDLGANIECNANQLVEFALLGEIYARIALGVKRPSLGLLNVGVEQVKGSETLKTAARTLESLSQQNRLEMDFKGFVEGDDIGKGTVDVIVTDGFSGNIALKTIEGTAKLLTHHLRQSFAQNFLSKLGYLFARASLNRFRDTMDPRRYNGAMLLGVNGIVVKSHGGTDKIGFAHAIGEAYQMVKSDIQTLISHEFSQFRQGLAALSSKDDGQTDSMAMGI